MDVYAAYAFRYKNITASTKLTVLNDFTSDAPFSLALFAGGSYRTQNQINDLISIELR
jgi:hypothetical protein